MKRSGIRSRWIYPGLFASLTTRAALRAFVGPVGLRPGYSGCTNVSCKAQ